MSARAMFTGLVIALVGAACASATYWALLAVPESTVAALALSAALLLLTILIVGCTVGAVIGVGAGLTMRTAAGASLRALPGFVLGLLVFAVLFWATSSIDDAWRIHRGEIDALLLRYAGTANTAWVHASAQWITWIVRWGVGLSAVAGATTGGVAGGIGGALRGLRAMVSPAALGASLAALVAGRLAWPIVYWRPASLPADSAEVIFASVKLGAGVLLGGLLIVAVLNVFARAARRA